MIVSLYHVQENVALEDVIVDHDIGDVIVRYDGIETLKSIDFSLNDVLILFHESILTVNLYLHVCRLFSVMLQCQALYNSQLIFQVCIHVAEYASSLNVVPEIS